MPPNLMIMKGNFMRQKAQSRDGFLSEDIDDNKKSEKAKGIRAYQN